MAKNWNKIKSTWDAVKQNNNSLKETKQQESQQEDIPVYQQTKTPFNNKYLDNMYANTVKRLGGLGVKNTTGLDPLKDAYEAVSLFKNVSVESGKMNWDLAPDTKDPMGVGMNAYEKRLKQLEYRYMTNGVNDYAGLKAIYDEKGFKTKSQWEQDNLDRAMAMATKGMDQEELARMQAAGEQDDMLARWMEDNPTMKTARENPALNKAMGDFYTNIDQYLQLVLHKGYEALPEDIREAYDQTNFINDRRWNENTPQEEWDALNAWGDEMAREYRDAAAIYQPYEVTDGYQTYLEEKMRATPEGAKMWLDEAMGTEEEQAARRNLWFVEQDAKYSAIPQNADFEELSKAKEQEINFWHQFKSDDEKRYAFINTDLDAATDAEISMLSDPRFAKYQYMTEEERDIYNYLYAQENGKKQADEYLEYLEYQLDERKNEAEAQRVYDLANGNGWAAAGLSALSVPASLMRGVNYIDVLGQSLFNGDKPVNYDRTAGAGEFADAARQGTMDSVDWNIKIFGKEWDVFDFLYGTGMSGIDSMAAAATGPWGGAALLATGAAQSNMQNALENGANQGEAIWMGAAAGAFELIFEKLSIGEFLKVGKSADLDSVKEWLKNMGKNALINAEEEFTTSVFDYLAEQAILGEKSEMNRLYNYYRDMGLTPDEAKKKMAADLAWKFGEDALGGAFMGAGMGMVADVQGYANTNSIDKKMGQSIMGKETEAQILEKAKAFGPDSLSAKSAQKYEKKKTPAGLGKVFRDTLATMDQRGRRELYDLTFGRVKKALNADGEIANVDAVATAIVDLYAGNRLDADEMQALAESKKGMDVAQELLGMDMLTMTALEDAGKAEKKGAAPVGELPKAVQAPEGMARQEAQEAETKGAAPVGELPKAIQAPEGMAQQSVEVTGADGSTTEIAEIREDDDGQAVIETADGNEIDLEEAGLTESQQQIANEARGTEYAAQILGAYTEAESMTTNARDFSRGFNRVAAAAANGKTLEEATKGIYAGKLSEAAKQAAYEAGQRARAQMAAQQSSATYKAAQRDGFRMLTADIGSKAGLYYANVTGKVTDAAKTMMRVIERFAEEAGIQIQVFDTLGKANGAYTQGTNVIRIALDADQGALTTVASHEVYHYIKDWNSDGADRLAKKVFEYLEKADGYNLDQRVKEKIQEYARANVKLSEDDAKEEIVADALLDFIGTEENFRAILSEDSKLADKIRAWVQQMMARIRSILETMAASSPEVRVLKDNEAYFAEIAAMMDGILEETREIMESTKKGGSARIKNDPAVTEYREDMRTAKDKSERQSALNGLMAEAFERTQKEWLKKRPDADMDSAIAEFREALSAYGRGEKFVQKALEDAGFISPTTGSNEMALLSFAGQQAAMMQERGEKGKVTVKSQEEEFSDKNTKYSIRKEAPPKNTIKGYKVFVVFKNKPGKLYPPMVANPGGESTPVGVWLNADVGAQAPDSKTGRKQVKAGGKGTQGGSGSLAFRPGWHLGDMPKATQFNRLNPETGVKELFPENFVWAECECAADHDYQEEAMSYGYNANGKFQHSLAGLPRLPREEDGTAGYYRYRTNPNPDTVPWIITGAMKVNRILDDAETEAILRENGIEPMKRVGGPIDLEKYGLKAGDVKESKYSLKESQTAPVEEGLKEDAELYAQIKASNEGKAALKILQKLYGMATRGDSYLMAGEKEALIEKGAWQKRMPEIMEKIKAETGSEINERKMRSDLAAIFNAMDRGEDVSDMLLAAKDLGRDILAEAPGMMNPIDPSVKEAMRILKDSRFYLTDEMKSEIRNTQYGSVAAYMRKNFGKMGIRAKAKDGKGGARKSLAEVWMELNEILPGTFQADATEADMPGIVDAWLETAGQRDFGGAFGQNIGAYSTDLGLSIMLEYFNLPGALETANKTKGEINLKIYQQKKEAREKYESRIRELKEKQERMRAEHQQKYEERIATLQAKLEYGKAREDLTKEIQSDVKYLNNRLAKATNTRHVPENMRQIVIKAIKPFLNSTSVFDGKTVSMLRIEYEKLATEQVNEETEAARMYNVNVLDSIKNMEKTVDGKLLTDLTLQQLWDVRDVIANIKGMVERANEMFTEGRNENYKALGAEEVIDLEEKKTIKNEKVMAAAFKNMTPPYFFKRIGGVFGRMWNDFRDGQEKWAKWMRDARTFADKMIKDYGMDKWLNGKETLRFTTKRGETIELNRQLALSLYATWQREIRNTMQNANHLRMGGFRYPKGMKPYEGVDMKRPHALTRVDMLHIQDFLGKNAMEFADKMVGYLSNDMARIGNEVSMQLYNIKTFKEKYYFPYQVSSDFLSQDLTKGDIALEDASGALKNWSATKKLQTKANNPVVIGEFMDIWAGHVNKMCIYGAFTIPADNMNRLYNYKTPVESDMTPTSVKQELSRVYGDGAGKYIATLIRDISGGVRAQDRTSVGKMVSKFKKGSVAGNLQVVIQQPSTIARVMAVMNPKYLMMPPGDIKKNIQEMREHSGIAIIKEMGRFDTGTGLSAVEWLQESVQEGSIVKRGMKTLDKITGWGAEKADLLTWQHIWHAVKKEVEAKAPELEVGSREYFDAVTQRFEEVIDYTQVYDSVLAKSELMRSNSTFDKMTTSFMAEPTITANMLQDAIMNVKEMGGKKKLLRATSVWVIATAFNAMLKSLVSAMRRKDDEERTYIEKYIAEVWGNFSGDMDPISLLPIGRDIASLLEGYDVERADMAIYAQMVDAWNILWNDKKSFKDKIQAVTGAAGNMLGIPAKNIWRDAEAMLNAIMANPDGGTEWRDIKYSVLDETPAILGQIKIWDDAATAYYARMADALSRGDMETFDELRGYLVETEGKKESTVTTGVKNAVQERVQDAKMDDETAMDALEALGMESNKAYYQVDEWKKEAAYTGTEEFKYGKYDDFYEAVESGANLSAVIKGYMDHGVSKSTLSSQITSQYKQQYIDLMKTNPAAAANLKAMLLTAYAALGYDRTKKAKDIDAWLK